MASTNIDISALQLTDIPVTQRAYRFIRQAAIKTVEDATVEMITNSDDAYAKKNDDANHIIDMLVDYDNRIIHYIDQAIGMDAATMEACFLQVGSYTSSEESRGYFSRGAKDISALGDVIFTAFKDNNISQCIITRNAQTSMIISDRLATEDERTLYKIAENGLHVELKLKSTVQLINYSTLTTNIKNHYALRIINTNPKTYFYMSNITDSKLSPKTRLVREKPPKTEQADFEFNVPGYADAIATFKLYIYDIPALANGNDYKYSLHGITISSGKAIHENSMFYSSLLAHPYAKYIYGELHCDYINKLMHDIEVEGETDANPHPLIDHSRTHGLSRQHPFTKALFDIPYKRLLNVLNKLENNKLESGSVPQLQDVIDYLNILGQDMFKNIADFESHNWSINKDSSLIAKIIKHEKQIISENEALPHSTRNIQKDFENGNVTVNSPGFELKFTKNTMSYRYYLYTDGNKFTLLVNANDHVVKEFIYEDDEGNYVGFDKGKSKVILAEIMASAFSEKLTLENSRESGDDYEMIQTQAFNTYKNHHHRMNGTIFRVFMGIPLN